MHEQQFQVGNVVHDKRLKASGVHVARLGVRTVANLGHGRLAGESTANTVINTLGLAPVRLRDGERERVVGVWRERREGRQRERER